MTKPKTQKTDVIKNIITTFVKPLEYLLQSITGQNCFGGMTKWFYQASSSNTSIKEMFYHMYKTSLSDQKLYTASLTIVITNMYEYITGTHPEDLYSLAIRNGDINALDMLISRDVYKNEDLFSDLVNHGHEAAAMHLFDSISMVLDQKDWNNILGRAVANGYLKIAKLALQNGADINSSSYGKSQIELAVFYNQPVMAKLLKEDGASIPDNILSFAVSDKHLESGLIPYLVEECEVNLDYMEDGATILMKSVSWEQTKLAKYLVEHNATVNISKGAWTALYDSLSIGEIGLALSLMQHGADLKDHTLLAKLARTSAKIDQDATEAVSFMLCKGGYTAQEAQAVTCNDMSQEVRMTLSNFIDDHKSFCDDYLLKEQNHAEDVEATTFLIT